MADFVNQQIMQQRKAAGDPQGEAIRQAAALSIQRQQSEQAQAQREMSQSLTALEQDWIPAEEKVRIANQLGKRFGIKGDVTMEGLYPYTKLLRDMEKDVNDGKDLSRWSTAVDLFQANPKFVDPSKRQMVFEAQQKIREQKVNEVVPEPTRPEGFGAAQQRLEQYGHLLPIANQNAAADVYDANLPASVDQPALVAQLRRDQALVSLTNAQQTERERLRFALRANPGLIDKALEGRLKEAGIGLSNPEEAFKVRSLNILQKPQDEQTDEERRFVSAWMSTMAPQHIAEQFGYMTVRHEQALAEREQRDSQGRRVIIEQALQQDGQAVQAIGELAAKRAETETAMSGKTVVPATDAQNMLEQATQWATMRSQARAAYNAQVAPLVEPEQGYFPATIAKTQEELEALKSRLIRAPLGQHEMLTKRIKQSEAALAANQAGLRLLTETSPFELEDLRGKLTEQDITIANAKARGDQETQGKAMALRTGIQTQLAQKEKARDKDLATVGSYQKQLLEREKQATQNMNTLGYKMEKEAGMRNAVNMAANLMSQGENLTGSVTNAAKQFGVDAADLAKKMQEFGNLQLPIAQQQFGTMLTAYNEKYQRLPDEGQMMKMATTVAKQYPLVKIQDLMASAKNPNKPMVEVNVGDKASVEAAKEFTKETRATYNQLKTAPVLLRNIEEAKALIPQAKGFMGPGGEGLLEAAKFLNSRIGARINTEGVKGAEELRSRLFFGIMENLKKMDAQPSEMQQIMMRDALGKLGTDPTALASVLDAYGDTIRDKVELFNKEVEGAMKKGTDFPYDPRIILPERRAASGEPIVRTDTEYQQLAPGTVYIGPDGKKRKKQ